MEPRLALNEDCAVELLQMIRDARQAWWREEGRYPSVLELCAREDPRPGRARNLIPAGFCLAQGGAALRSGYLFFEFPRGVSEPTGCRAVPKLSGTSGNLEFELEYSSGKINSLAASD